MKNTTLFLLAAAALAFSGRPGRSDLVFIDDFQDPNPRHSSPVPGMPGGGLIGGTDFWSNLADHGNTGSNTVSGGVLTMTSVSITSENTGLRLRSGAYGEFDFMRAPVGEGLLLSIRDFSMDWGNYGRFYVGFHSGDGSFFQSTNKFFVNVWSPDAFHPEGRIRMFATNSPGTLGNALMSFDPAGAERPIGFDLYLDSVFVSLTAYYDDQTERFFAAAHGLNPGDWAQTQILQLKLQPRNTDGIPAVATIGEITVTRIPEPGTASLLGLIGAAWLIRRRRVA